MSDDQATDETPQDLGSAPGRSAAGAHPEEMRAAIRFGEGDRIFAEATARATPAGLITLAVVVAAVLVPLAIFLKRADP